LLADLSAVCWRIYPPVSGGFIRRLLAETYQSQKSIPFQNKLSQIHVLFTQSRVSQTNFSDNPDD
jgi:hypothetical protein